MVENIPLPRLLPGATWTERRIMPEKVSVNLNITPLSHATITLPECESVPARGYIEVFTCMGSAGIYRVRAPQESYGNDSAVAELEHAVVEVGDWLVLASYDEMKAAGTAMTTIFSHYRGTKWQLGSVTALGSGNVAMQANHISVLEAMLAIMEQKPDCMMTFDFSTTPWTINIVQRGTTVAAEGRLSRNINFAKITYDDTELCTRAYYEKEVPASGDAQPTSEWLYVDADTIGTYGLIERSVATGSNYTAAEALQAATTYLNKHKHPRISVEVNLEELSHETGEPMDTFEIGKLCRLALVDYNTTVEKHITGMGFPDVYDQPTNITVNLAEEEDAVINFVHDIDAKGGYGGGGAGRRKQDQQFKEYRTRFDQDDYHIALVSEHADRANNILQAAGIDINSQTGVVIYHTDNENMLQSKMNVQAGQIGLVVQGTGENASIKAAQIWASIDTDMRQSHVTISADIIDIDGIVDDLVGYDVAAESLTAHQITSDGECSFDTVVAGSVQVGSGEDVYELNVADISVSGNTMTITYVDGTTENFSKATTVSGSWSGTVYTATATPGPGTASTSIHMSVDGANNPNQTVYVKTFHDNPSVLANQIDLRELKMEELVSSKRVKLSVKVDNNGTESWVEKGSVPTTSTYNAGWDYGLTQRVRSTADATSQELTTKTLDYDQRWTIKDTYTNSDGTTTDVKYTVAAPAVTTVGTITLIDGTALSGTEVSNKVGNTYYPSGSAYVTASGTACTSHNQLVYAEEGTCFPDGYSGTETNCVDVKTNGKTVVRLVPTFIPTTLTLTIPTTCTKSGTGQSATLSAVADAVAKKTDGTVVLSNSQYLNTVLKDAYLKGYSDGGGGGGSHNLVAGSFTGPETTTNAIIQEMGTDNSHAVAMGTMDSNGYYGFTVTCGTAMKAYYFKANISGGGSHNPTIDNVWTSQSIPSGAIPLNSLKTQFMNALNDSDNFCIRIKCGGSTNTYYCTP